MIYRFILCLCLFILSARAATLVSDGTAADVASKLNSASAGDTVTIPEGIFNWSSQVLATVAQNVWLQGAGDSSVGGGDATIIVDQFDSGTFLLGINVPATGVFRVSGITFRAGDIDPVKENGTIILVGPGSVRLHNLHFDWHTVAHGQAKPVWIGNLVYGVVHDCIMDFVSSTSIYVGNGAGTDGKGNQVWAEPTGFGGANFIFFEDNLYRATSAHPADPCRLADVFSGGRTVWRFNTLQGSAGLEVHATGHAGDDRGARASEGYGNKFEVLPGNTPPFDAADIGAGTFLVWGNTFDANALKNIFLFKVTRSAGLAGGYPYDQAATPAGWGYAGTTFDGTGSNWDGGTYNATDTATGYPTIDQPGRGGSQANQILVGSFPTKTNSLTGTIKWPDQPLEPIYFWNNTGVQHPTEGGAYFSNSSGGRIASDRDYYAQASGIQTVGGDHTTAFPFTGQSGTGWGPFELRPTTCTTGVAYFATDQGSWNQSSSNPRGVQQNGADGVLYVATATNTWTLYYEPYTYPHPLRADGAQEAPRHTPRNARGLGISRRR